MKQATLWILVEHEKILLCMKKRGFWVGKWNGAGGKVDLWETVAEGMIRELHEETLLECWLEDIKTRGLLHFYFSESKTFAQDVHVFEILQYQGSPTETEEMRPEWYALDAIPYSEMWEDDVIWLPRFLKGETFEYDFYFDVTGHMTEYRKIR